MLGPHELFKETPIYQFTKTYLSFTTLIIHLKNKSKRDVLTHSTRDLNSAATEDIIDLKNKF